jgi:hypothetical protein
MLGAVEEEITLHQQLELVDKVEEEQQELLVQQTQALLVHLILAEVVALDLVSQLFMMLSELMVVPES